VCLKCANTYVTGDGLNSPRIALIHHGGELIGLLVLVRRHT
jgi:hypothetical protein